MYVSCLSFQQLPQSSLSLSLLVSSVETQSCLVPTLVEPNRQIQGGQLLVLAVHFSWTSQFSCLQSVLPCFAPCKYESKTHYADMIVVLQHPSDSAIAFTSIARMFEVWASATTRWRSAISRPSSAASSPGPPLRRRTAGRVAGGIREKGQTE